MDVISLCVGFGLGIAVSGFALAILFFLKPWLRSFFSGGKISVFQIIGMRLRGSPVNLLVDTYISFVQKGQPRSFPEIESHYIANQHKIHSVGDLIQSLDAVKPNS